LLFRSSQVGVGGAVGAKPMPSETLRMAVTTMTIIAQ
jgi:hypothetical protein